MKKSPTAPSESHGVLRRTIHVGGASAAEQALNFAALTTDPELAACRVVYAAEKAAGGAQHLEVPMLMEALRSQTAAVIDGNMVQTEAMLLNQAIALQSIFARLAETAMLQANDLPSSDTYLRLAFKAQSQCRTTLETLAAIKNPPVIYARQANIANGPQQINNGAVEHPRAREIQKDAQTQLSAGGNDALLQDARASGNASRTNPALEAVGKIKRTKVRGG